MADRWLESRQTTTPPRTGEQTGPGHTASLNSSTGIAGRRAASSSCPTPDRTSPSSRGNAQALASPGLSRRHSGMSNGTRGTSRTIPTTAPASRRLSTRRAMAAASSSGGTS
ncbi:hypothetical protein BJF81_08540 [Ornithinimicrobium sp. CNJ-824]|nr:hypothetical protein BJF81_08540 [Ornithinimicrobium sp. CNJ-824]